MRYIPRSNLKLIIMVLAGILLLTAALFALGVFNEPEETTAGPTYSQLTGVEVEPEVAERPILGIMIENSPAARPQTGVDNAGLVLEAATEGGITRYLALYQEDIPEIIGPVRSLRPHFLNWAMGFDASIAHVGGSAEALEMAEERNAKSLNQFNHPNPYYRDEERAAPHNMYVRTEGLRNLQEELGHNRSQFEEFPRKEDSPNENPDAANISVGFEDPSYDVEFRYDKESNSYTRYLAGSPDTNDGANQPVTVKNVIVIKSTGQETGFDSIGSGEALVFMDGTAWEVRWELPDFEERLKIIDNDGNQVPLNRGSAWITAIANDRPVNH